MKKAGKWSRELLYVPVSALISFMLVKNYDWGVYEFISIFAAFFFFLLVIGRLGKTIPVREFAAFVYVLQLLIGALLTYKFYPHIKIGFMAVNEDRYYGYVMPSLAAFIAGLFIPKFKYTNFDASSLMNGALFNKAEWIRIGWILIGIGYLAEILMSVAPSEGLSFIYVLFSFFKFAGLFYVWIAGYKYKWPVTLFIFVPFAWGSLSNGLFIEVFVWGFFIFAVLQLSKPLKFRTNLLVFAFGIVMIFLLQSVKADFRRTAWKTQGELTLSDRLSLWGGLISNVDLSDPKTRDIANIRFIVRINQGYIVASILRNMPARHDFVDGEYLENELIGIFVPRFLFPDKAVVGSHKKFREFAGWNLDERVAMSVSILGDGYGNFGYWGGIFFCFLNGLLLNFLLHYCFKLAVRYERSLILWLPIIFTYSVRCGDEFYIITNHIFKSSILIFGVFFILRKSGRLARMARPARKLSIT
ncbi:MAG TPA: hypothetical protein VNU70_06200 [Puia sp.]|nr:hypothetical protein [Puia sp.]